MGNMKIFGTLMIFGTTWSDLNLENSSVSFLGTMFFLEFVLARFLHHMMTPSKEKHRALVYLCRHLHGTKHYINPSWEFPPNWKYVFFFQSYLDEHPMLSPKKQSG